MEVLWFLVSSLFFAILAFNSKLPVKTRQRTTWVLISLLFSAPGYFIYRASIKH